MDETSLPRDLHVPGTRPALHCLLNAVIALAFANSEDRQRMAAHWLDRAARCLREEPVPSPAEKARLAAAYALISDRDAERKTRRLTLHRSGRPH